MDSPDELRHKADELIMYHSYIHARWQEVYDDYEIDVTEDKMIETLEALDRSVDAVLDVSYDDPAMNVLSRVYTAGQVKGEWIMYELDDDVGLPNDLTTDVAVLMFEFMSAVADTLTEDFDV